MNRRIFLKLLGLSPIAPSILMAKEKFGPSKLDKEFAELQELVDFSSQSAPFIQFEGIWFFADQHTILYCPNNKLHSTNWNGIHLVECNEFDFWFKNEGRLYWCGKREKWEILPQPRYVEVRFVECFDN